VKQRLNDIEVSDGDAEAADGVEQASDGRIFVSSFELGAVWRMDAQGENLKVLVDHVGFQTTADFYRTRRPGCCTCPTPRRAPS
jgi:hypothetical protein